MGVLKQKTKNKENKLFGPGQGGYPTRKKVEHQKLMEGAVRGL
jgi:hypothetical protein